MRRFALFANLLMAGFLSGCTSEVDMANMRDNTLQSTQIRSDQVTTIQERVARLEASEEERQRSLIRMTGALDELRLEQRKLRGELEESQYRQEQVGTNLDYRLTALDQRLRLLETRPGVGGIAPGQLGPGSEPPPPLEPGLEIEPPVELVAEPTLPAPESEPVAVEPPATPEPEVVAVEPPPTPEPEPVVEPPALPPEEDPEAIRLLQRAREDYQQGNYEVAIILFKQYLRQYPQSAQAGDAQYWVGESLYAQKEFNAAIVAFDEVIQQYPQNEMVAAATLKVGLSFANLDDKPNARFFLQQVQEKFANSAEAQLATEKLKQLRR
jgi:tol-pal system protein YbgF